MSALWLQTITLAIGISGIVVGLMAFLMNRERRQPGYDFQHNRAILSDMRDYYEAKIASLNRDMVSTKDRWEDANHLLLSSQQAQRENVGRNHVPYTEYLRSLGLTERDLEVDSRLVFVMTPVLKEEEATYSVIADVCMQLGYRCVRADQSFGQRDAILSQIVRLIARANIVIANVTSRNPNVFYELGLAHAFDKVTILVSRSISDVPFDVQSRRILLFSSEAELRALLTPTLFHALNEDQY